MIDIEFSVRPTAGHISIFYYLLMSLIISSSSGNANPIVFYYIQDFHHVATQILVTAPNL